VISRWQSGFVVAVALVFLLPSHARAQRERFELKVGAAYEQGDFGTSDTTRSFFVPVALKYLGDRFDVGLTVPFIYLETQERIAVVEGVPSVVRKDRQRDVSASGLGDIVLKGRWFALEDRGPDTYVPGLAPFGKIKFPTADEDRSLGTGEADYGLGLEFDKALRGFFLFGDLGYTFIGDPPGQDLRDRPSASLGAGVRLSDTYTLAGLLDWRRALLAGRDDPLELVGILTVRLSPTMALRPNAFVGLTDGSPDFGVGIELSYKFGRY